MPIPFEDGAPVEVRGETWRLARADRFDACAILTLVGRDRSNAGARFRVVVPFDRPRPLAARRLRRRSRHAAMADALNAVAGVRRAPGLWTAASAAIDLLPYQLEPALAVVSGATRLLLADAVGLGKTIQAGLILSELRERGWIEHALIVCPAGLRHTWARELCDRFHIPATILDQPSIAERIATLPPGISPWSGHGVAIASIDLVKRPEVLAAIVREPIDLVIADEAHHLAPGTDRGAAVSRLASRAPWCVFVSATPHSGDRAAFDYLTSLGAAGDPITIFRRRRSDAGLADSRRTHLLRVTPSAAEQSLLDAIEHYARAIWIARGRDDHTVRLIATTMARRAASSTAAITRTLERRLALLSGAAVESLQPGLPWLEPEDADDLDGDAALAAPGLVDTRDERAALQHLLALARAAGASTKFARVARLLDRAREPAVVFTEYRDTLAALGSRLSLSRRVLAIHGGLPADARRDIVEAFNDGRADVLVATDAAGEGLNLHHRCRLVIDLELPWNPLRLEQRIGRVDRLGQRRIVHGVRLFHPGTIESAVLEHLRLRRRRADEALDRPVSDAAIAAAIFDGAPIGVDALVIRSHAIDGRAETRRLEWQRRVGRIDAPGIRTLCPPRSRSRSPLMAVRRTTWTNAGGYSIGDEIGALRIWLARTPAAPGEWRALIDQLESAVDPPPIQCPPRDALVARIHAIRERLKRDLGIRYQRSLFDRRADADAAARDAVAARLNEALARVLRSVDSTAAFSRSELGTVWPEHRW